MYTLIYVHKHVNVSASSFMNPCKKRDGEGDTASQNFAHGYMDGSLLMIQAVTTQNWSLVGVVWFHTLVRCSFTWLHGALSRVSSCLPSNVCAWINSSLVHFARLIGMQIFVYKSILKLLTSLAFEFFFHLSVSGHEFCHFEHVASSCHFLDSHLTYLQETVNTAMFCQRLSVCSHPAYLQLIATTSTTVLLCLFGKKCPYKLIVLICLWQSIAWRECMSVWTCHICFHSQFLPVNLLKSFSTRAVCQHWLFTMISI